MKLLSHFAKFLILYKKKFSEHNLALWLKWIGGNRQLQNWENILIRSWGVKMPWSYLVRRRRRLKGGISPICFQNAHLDRFELCRSMGHSHTMTSFCLPNAPNPNTISHDKARCLCVETSEFCRILLDSKTIRFNQGLEREKHIYIKTD